MVLDPSFCFVINFFMTSKTHYDAGTGTKNRGPKSTEIGRVGRGITTQVGHNLNRYKD